MHRVVSREQWMAERLELVAEDKEFTRRRHALAEKRRALPWVCIDKLVFYKDESGAVYHTYSNYSRGGDDFMTIYRVLEITPKGRRENGPHFSLTDWARPRTMYGKGSEVATDGRFTSPVSCCM
jgi:predicted dithiol-disulfide oxidoreductase (DUF899 family)